MNSYYPGTQIKVQAVFLTTAAVEIDPTTAMMWYRKPSGTVTAVAFADLTKVTTGTYYYPVTPTSSEHGEWIAKFRSDGNIKVAAEIHFKVQLATVST
jgi:hypothetical protein